MTGASHLQTALRYVKIFLGRIYRCTMTIKKSSWRRGMLFFGRVLVCMISNLFIAICIECYGWLRIFRYMLRYFAPLETIWYLYRITLLTEAAQICSEFRYPAILWCMQCHKQCIRDYPPGNYPPIGLKIGGYYWPCWLIFSRSQFWMRNWRVLIIVSKS